jgi:hypothetical protein
MLSDVTFKAAAMMQLGLYEAFKGSGCAEAPLLGVPLATGVCVTDTVIDTVKYPVAAIENVFFATVNIVGAACVDACRLEDAWQNLKKAALGVILSTPVMLLLSPFKLIGHLCATLPNMGQAHTCNPEADMEANLPWLTAGDGFSDKEKAEGRKHFAFSAFQLRDTKKP